MRTIRLWVSGASAVAAPVFNLLLTVGLLFIVAGAREAEAAEDASAPMIRVLEPTRSDVLFGEELQLLAGDDLLLQCEADEPVKWMYPSHIYFEPEITQRKDGDSWHSTLRLQNATRYQTGFFSCALDRNSTSEVYSSLYIYFADPTNPWVYDHVIPTNAEQNKEALLDCRPNNRSLKVRLFDNRNAEIQEGLNSNGWTVSWSPTYGFTVKPITIHDEGVLHCEVDGKTDLVIYLTVLLADTNMQLPVITPMDAQPHAVLGRSMRLQCKLRAKGLYDSIWLLPPGSRAEAEDRLNITDPKLEPKNDAAGFRVGTINLTITDLKDSDAGIYTCIIRDHQKELNSTFDLEVKDGSVHYIHLQEDKVFLHQTVRQNGNATWVIEIVTFPPNPTVTWFGNDGKQLSSNSLRHIMTQKQSGRGVEVMLTITEVQLEDRGSYSLLINTPEDEEKENLTLEVLAPPVVDLKHKEVPVPLNRPLYASCRVKGYPLPSVHWAWRPCPNLLQDCSPDGPYQPLPDALRWTSSGIDVNSTINFTRIESSGYLSCSANNTENNSSDRVYVQVTDIPGDDDFLVWTEQPVALVGDDLKLWCGALRENHTEYPRWERTNDTKKVKLNEERMWVNKINTTLSLRTVLHISKARKDDSGTYKCYIGEDGGEFYRGLHLSVKAPQKPFASGAVLNDTEWVVNDRDTLRLPCSFNGLPTPTITWFKDGQTLTLPTGPKDNNRIFLEQNGTILVLNFITEVDQGEYRCQASNRVGIEESWARITVKNTKGLQVSMVILIAVLVLLVIAIVPLALCFYKEKKRRRMVISGLHHFTEGQPDVLNPELPADEQAELLPYDKKWEFPRDRLKLGKQLGAGAFGVVLKAEAQGIVEGEESTTVAVKMVKRTADFSYLMALASELKIMVHLGKHLNVVNLLGACTTNIERLELLVIVEYCRFGNLHNYLLRHREGFVDQVDPRTGAVDVSIGADRLQGHDSLTHSGVPGGRLKYASLSFSGSTDDTTGSSDAGSEAGRAVPVGPVDYRAAAAAAAAAAASAAAGGACVDSMGSEAICMSPIGGEDAALTSNGSAQPHWRSNYRGDYRGNVRPISTRDLLCWSYQVARGMQYLAGRKVLHGDLAARNILLADGNIVKICDFGLAKSMYKSGNYKKKGDGPLPVKWMALESIRDGIFSTQSDVWSFGIVLWELFTLAQTPYPGMIADKRLYSKLQEGYRMEKPPYATEDLYRVMRTCWESRPVRRPTFEELAETLGGYLEESVRNHYLDLNNAYIDMNEQWRQDGVTDYLGMLGAPDYSNMVAPRDDDYINSPASPAPSSPLACDGYLMMRGAVPGSGPPSGPATPRSAEVFSPRPGSGSQVFTFTGPRAPAVTSPSPSAFLTDASLAVNNPDYAARLELLKTNADNYVNVPQQRLAAAAAAAAAASGANGEVPSSSPLPAARYAPQPLCEPLTAPGAFSNPNYGNAPVIGFGNGQHACA